jgi:hypothetical protein
MATSLIEELNKILESSRDESYYGTEDVKAIIDLISKDNRYNIFINHCHRLGATSSICFNQINEFPNQIIRRAKEVGSEQTVNEIENYLNGTEIQIECGLLLYSIHLDTEFTFLNGVRLIQTRSLIDSNLTNFLIKEKISTGGFDTALLVIDYVTPKEYYSSLASESIKTDWTKIEVKTDLIKVLDDTRFILSLGRNPSFGIPVVGSFEIIPDHLQFLNNGVGYGTYPEPRQGIGPKLIAFEIEKADELLKKFDSLSTNDKERIIIAFKRLNDAKIDSNWANKSINLRICIENLFCTEGESAIAQTISERAPTYTNFSKTRARKVYGFLSSAVHKGIQPEHATITESEIIAEVHKTIIQYIENGGYPIWPDKQKKNKFIMLWTCIKSLFD